MANTPYSMVLGVPWFYEAKKPEKIERQKNQEWTHEEIKKLKAVYPVTANYELVKVFNRSEQAIQAAAKRYGLRKSKSYIEAKAFTKEEIACIIDLFPNHLVREIAEKLGRGIDTVSKKARQLGLKRTKQELWELKRKRKIVKNDSNIS